MDDANVYLARILGSFERGEYADALNAIGDLRRWLYRGKMIPIASRQEWCDILLLLARLRLFLVQNEEV